MIIIAAPKGRSEVRSGDRVLALPRACSRSARSRQDRGLLKNSDLRPIEVKHRGPLTVAVAAPKNLSMKEMSDCFCVQIAVEIKESRVQSLISSSKTQRCGGSYFVEKARPML